MLALVLGGAGAWLLLFPEPASSTLGGDHGVAPLAVYVLVAGFDCLLIDWPIKGAEQNAALADRNDLLMRELQHRVKNHVQLVSSLLSIQASQAETGAREALLDPSRRVHVVALLYRDLYVPSDQVDVAEHLRHLCRTAQEGFAHAKITVSIPSDPIAWSMDKVMLVSLIASELMTNAFRHGLAQRAGTIAVSLRRLDDAFELSVSDTGGRFPRFRPRQACRSRSFHREAVGERNWRQRACAGSRGRRLHRHLSRLNDQRRGVGEARENE